MKIINFFTTIFFHVNQIVFVICQTTRSLYFKAERTFDKNNLTLYLWFIGWGIIAGATLYLLTQLLKLNPEVPLSGQRLLFYSSSVFYTWIYLTITQFWKRNPALTPLLVDAGIVTGLFPFSFIFYSGNEIFIGPIMIYIFSFLMLVFMNSFYLAFTGQLEWD